jgi:group II intron reverse transcriptase/maturase
LESIYEQDFLNCSYGGRPARNAHQPVSKLKNAIADKNIAWVYEADLKNFFGSLDHTWLLTFLQHRMIDERILTLIRRWLKAGVMNQGKFEESEHGTPQGGSISVLLSNVYLHYVLGLWFEKIVKPRLSREAYLTRYLDDFVVCFQSRTDAERFQTALDGRLAKFSLQLEPNKTKLMKFGRFEKRYSKREGVRSPTFCFLGFRFFGLHIARGLYVAAAVVDGTRRNRFINRLKESMRLLRHQTLKDQALNINRKLRGYFNYFAIPLNSSRLQSIHYIAIKYWKSVLSSRSQSGLVNWSKFNIVLSKYPICKPRIRFSIKQFIALGES